MPPRDLDGLRALIARMNETNASPRVFEDFARDEGWTSIDQGDIRAWELVRDGIVVARVFGPFGGGAWRLEAFPGGNERPTLRSLLRTTSLERALEELARGAPVPPPTPTERAARRAQARLEAAEDRSDQERDRYRDAAGPEREAARASFDEARAEAAKALRDSRAADRALADERDAPRGRARPRGD